MEARLQKWGNSFGVRIPSSILKNLDLKGNDKLELKEEEDKIIITKVKDERISLADRIKKYNGENLSKEFEWDSNKGKEIW